MTDIILSIELVIGIIGAIFIMMSWLWETEKLAKTKSEHLSPLHPELTLIGVIFLILYSFFKNDSVFLILNIFVAFMAGMALSYTLKRKKTK